MPNLLINPDQSAPTLPIFVTVALDDENRTFGLVRGGSAELKEYEPGKWCVTAEVLQSDGTMERRPMPDTFLFQSEGGDLVDFLNNCAWVPQG